MCCGETSEFSPFCQQYWSLGEIYISRLYLPDVVGVLTEEDVHDGGDQHVDEDEYDQRVELAGTPVQGKQLGRSGQVR